MNHLAILPWMFVLCGPALAQGVDLDRDGLDDSTGAFVPSSEPSASQAAGPIHVLDLGALGIGGPVNSATWEFDESIDAPNGARGYLWVGDTGNAIVHKIDALTPAVVASLPLTVEPTGLGWDGEHLVVQSRGWDTISLVDPSTGAVLSSVPTVDSHAYGICWRPGLEPTPDQYLWSTNFSSAANLIVGHVTVNQIRHLTGAKLFTFRGADHGIGALTDGKTFWSSNRSSQGIPASYRQWDMETGAPLKILLVDSVDKNPRDGTWDGHHLWDVNWANGGFAWQWDLYDSIQLYPVTVALGAKSITAAPGGTLVVPIGLKNHSPLAMTANVRLDFIDASGNSASLGDPRIQEALQPGEVRNLQWTWPVPPAWSAGDTLKLRATLAAPTAEDSAEDWAIVRVL